MYRDLGKDHDAVQQCSSFLQGVRGSGMAIGDRCFLSGKEVHRLAGNQAIWEFGVTSRLVDDTCT